MRAKRYTSKFANQFRQDYLVYTSAKEQQYDHVMIRQFAGNEQETEWLAKELTQTIHDVPLISRMITTMDKEAIPQAALLIEYGHELKALFTTYSKEESYTATFYSNMVSAITDLQELAETFQRDTGEHLLDKLKIPLIMYTSPERVLDIDTDTLQKIDNVIEYYLDNFDAYDNYFNALIRQEMSHTGRVAVTSQVADQLTKLVSFTDNIINIMQATREILFAWEMQLSSRETQELYN
jgi:hypothetical protein